MFLCSCWQAAAKSQPSPGEYLDACWGLAQGASLADRWQLKQEREINLTLLYQPSFCKDSNVKHALQVSQSHSLDT